jgi:arylformamidase
MGWIDVSVPLRDGMVVYEGDPPARIERVAEIARGDMANITHLDLGAHTGTHVDAPAHFLPGGAGADRLPLDVLIGPAVVADLTARAGDIDAAALGAVDLPDGTERLLLKTRNSALWARDAFVPEFAGLTDAAARELVARGVRLVGIDYLSIAPSGDPAPTHRTLLGAGVVIVEGLDLRAVAPGRYELVCLPLRIAGADGAPARALLRAAPGRGAAAPGRGAAAAGARSL